MSERGGELYFPSGNIPMRFFKACRLCRKQKMRCDARNQVPCSRCRSTGRDCILDPIEAGARRRTAAGRHRTPVFDHARQPNISHGSDTSSRELQYSPVSGRDVPLERSIDSFSSLVSGRDHRSSQGGDAHGPESQQLSQNDMIAPVSMVHSMSVNLLGSNSIFTESSTEVDLKKDIVERGIVSEEYARVMYERFIGGSKNFLGLFDPIRDTFDSIRSRSLFCFSVIIYLASRAMVDLRSDTHLQRVLQDEAQRLAEDSFFERPTKVETVQGMILLAAYSEKTWFSIALILRTALDSGLEKSLDRLLAQESVPRSSLSATLEERKLVWQTRTWLISFTLELDVASGTGRKSRIAEVNITKLRKFLEYPLSLPCDMRTVSIIEIHQLRGQYRQLLENCKTIDEIITKELPAMMSRLQSWWLTWDEIHENNGFHAGAFQRCSLKLMLNYARVFSLCASLARIQKLQPTASDPEQVEQDVLGLWKSLVTTIMDQLGFLIAETSYRCQFPWSPTYPALNVAFIKATFALRIARWRPTLINQELLLERAQQICDFLREPPYPDIHRTVSIFVTYARALIADLHQHQHHRPKPPSDQNADMPDADAPDGHGHDRPAAEPNSNLSHLAAPELPQQLEASSPRGGSALYPGVQGTPMSMAGGGYDKPAGTTVTSKPPLPKIPGAVEVPTWTLSNSIADSFGLFEEEQNDIFDFLPAMPVMPSMPP